MTTTQDLLRQRFSELCAGRDAILAQSEPLRLQRDDLTRASEAALAAQVAPLNAQIIEVEAGLAELMNEVATISRALDGKTGVQ